MVRAAMAELQLERLATDGEPQDLMSEADAEGRDVGLDELAHVLDRVRQRRGISGTVAQKDAIGLNREKLARRGIRGKYPDVAAVRIESPKDVPLDAEIVGGNAQAL